MDEKRKESKEEKKESMYSYHNFLFPFLLQKEKLTVQSLRDAGWHGWRSRGQDWGEYKAKQFFYPPVYQALYRSGKSLVGEYIYRPGETGLNYHIKKAGLEYTLKVRKDGIRLKIYKTGIAVLILECEYWEFVEDSGKNKQQLFENAKNINDYGRRMVLPFYSKDSSGSVCADKLELKSDDGKTVAECDFEAWNNDLYRCGGTLPEGDRGCPLIQQLLGLEKGTLLRPALDDRMFVACAVMDGETTKRMQFERDAPEDRLNKSLYEFLFVDPSNGCTCQDKGMRNTLLEEHIYPRWIDFGSLFGIEAQSIVLLMSWEDPENHVVESFRTLYTQMSCMALVQKASLMNFQTQCAELAECFDDGKWNSIWRLLKLRKDLSIFEGQMCFEEISSQEQPIEMYDMLRKSLLLPRELENVRAQMDGLNDIASAKLNIRLSWVGIVLAAISALLALITLFS